MLAADATHVNARNATAVTAKMKIKKKTWPELFQKMLDGKKNADVRLADFDAKEGDIIIFEEYDPETNEYTGRKLEKKIKNLTKIRVTDFNPVEDIKKYGHFVMELENV